MVSGWILEVLVLLLMLVVYALVRISEAGEALRIFSRALIIEEARAGKGEKT